MCGWVGPFLLTFAQNLLSKVLGISQLHWLIGDGRVQPRRPSHSKTTKPPHTQMDGGFAGAFKGGTSLRLGRWGSERCPKVPHLV